MKIMFFSLPLFLFLLPSKSACTIIEMQNDRFASAFSAGYVFKHNDSVFKEVYGRGMGNVITADFCYYPWLCWGIGGKISYWLAFGKTTFFKRHTTLHEIPLTIYFRRILDFKCCLQLYASLGAGASYMREKSYLGKVHHWKGIGEVEVGLNYPLWCRLDFTSAFRYLFPRQKQNHIKTDVGGFDLRAGVGFSY